MSFWQILHNVLWLILKPLEVLDRELIVRWAQSDAQKPANLAEMARNQRA
jgi:hypothetical protein